MMKAKRPVYEAINVLGTELVNASSRGQNQLYEILFDALKSVCLRQINQKVRDPFLYETMGDFAPRLESRIRFYKRALAVASEEEGAQYSILISLGECYLAQSKSPKARQFFEKALADAKTRKSREGCILAKERLAELETGRNKKGKRRRERKAAK